MTKKFLFALLYATRVMRFVAWLNRNKVTILCYHSVTPRPRDSEGDPHKLHLQVDSFQKHLDYLQTHYQVISLAEFVKAHRAQIKPPANAAILTFDDGARNFLTVVAPILRERGIPATSFVVTGASFTQEASDLNGHWSPADDNSYLSWSEIRKLANTGFDFGSHTCNHHALPDIPLSKAQDELEGSLRTLQTYLGPKSFPLSFPHGKTSAAISEISRSLEYSCALTSALGKNDMQSDLYALRRTVIASDDSLPTFVARVSGVTFLYGQISSIFNRRPRPICESTTIPYDRIGAEEFES